MAEIDDHAVADVAGDPFDLLFLGLTLRARAGRSGGWAPAVGPFDEFDGDDECDGEGDLVEAVVDEAVGVAA